jgi:hypothetical protein
MTTTPRTVYGIAVSAEIRVLRTARERVGGRWTDGVYTHTTVSFSDGRTALCSGFALDVADARRRVARYWVLRMANVTLEPARERCDCCQAQVRAAGLVTVGDCGGGRIAWCPSCRRDYGHTLAESAGA